MKPKTAASTVADDASAQRLESMTQLGDPDQEQRASTLAMEEQSDLLKRLTSTLAAEEVNRQFEQYIENVPDFGVAAAYTAGYKDGYAAGYSAGVTAKESEQKELAFESEVPEGALASSDLSSDLLLGLAPFRKVVVTAFGLSSALFLLVALCGFATFGDAADPLILNNYASSDPLAEVARIGVLLAVLFEFPLLERPFRLTALELLLPIPQFTGAITKIANGPIAAIASVTLISGIAATRVPLDTLAALGGSTGGALLIYIAPALMALKLRASKQGEAVGAGEQILDGDVSAATSAIDPAAFGLWCVAALGVALAVVGTLDTLDQLL
mmetsp:Transcript_7942/g.20767  ORF Transcript_7942/g.20767 Transcript_7942/m.20767 type:complete len:328 (-) Transcript_7942:2122-3105(-)